MYVRVNPVPTEWFADDVADGVAPGDRRASSCRSSRRPSSSATVADALDDAGLEHLHVLAGHRERARRRPRARAARCRRSRSPYFGAEDFIADMGGVRTLGSTEVLYARSRVALAARIAGVPAIDQVVTRLDAEDHFLADAADGPRPRLPGQALHPPGPGHAGQPRRSRRRPRRSTAPGASSPRTTTRSPAARPPSPSRARWSTSRSPATPEP